MTHFSFWNVETKSGPLRLFSNFPVLPCYTDFPLWLILLTYILDFIFTFIAIPRVRTREFLENKYDMNAKKKHNYTWRANRLTLVNNPSGLSAARTSKSLIGTNSASTLCLILSLNHIQWRLSKPNQICSVYKGFSLPKFKIHKRTSISDWFWQEFSLDRFHCTSTHP